MIVPLLGGLQRLVEQRCKPSLYLPGDALGKRVKPLAESLESRNNLTL